MHKVISIYDAKTNLSKLVKKAEAGETIYIGAYGRAQAVISPLPKKKPVRIGLFDKDWFPGAWNDEDFVGPDQEIIDAIEETMKREEEEGLL